MGRVGRNRRGLQVTSRVTWTFSARAPGLGRTRPTPAVHRARTARVHDLRPARAVERLVSILLVRPVVRALRPHPRRHAPYTRRAHRPLRRTGM